MTLANRLVGHLDIAPAELVANPKNWRIHPQAQADELTALLDRYGWVSSVIAQVGTLLVLDGHLRVQLALARGEPTLPVDLVDVDDAEADRILATLDPLGALARRDDAKLRDLLDELPDLTPRLDALLAETRARLRGPAASAFLNQFLPEGRRGHEAGEGPRPKPRRRDDADDAADEDVPEPRPSPQPEPRPAPAHSYAPLVFNVTPDERDDVLAALGTARAALGLESSNEALVAIAVAALRDVGGMDG